MMQSTASTNAIMEGTNGQTGLDAPPGPGRLTMAGVVALFVIVGHVWSVDTGLYLDDHSHFLHLRRDDWSFRSAVDAARLGVVGEVMDLWGRREAGLRFFRPIAFWIMKIEYTIARWDPLYMHLFSLGWHYTCSMLVGALAMRCFGRRFWALVAASLTAIHPGHTATVYWVACQTELITTTLLLIAVLAYARHAGWSRPMFIRGPVPPRDEPWSQPAVTPASIVAIVCYGLALGCRENALLFPLVCWAGDRLCGSRRRRWFRWEHLAMLAVLATYLVLRWHTLGGFPMPAKPYLVPITDPDFPRFALDKLAQCMIALFAYVPVVPIGGRVYFSTRPLVLYGGLAGTLLFILLIWLVYRRHRALAWPAVWMAFTLAPVMPVFASSHHLYLPGVGAALLTTAFLAALAGITLPAGVCAPRPPRWTCGVLIAVHALGLSLVTWGLGFAYVRGTMVEDLVIEDVLRSPRPIRNGDHLFFVNMPVIAYYVVPAIKTHLGLHELYGHVLTFSPDLLRMESPGTIDVLDAHRLRVGCGPDRRYLEGVTGQMLLGVMDLTGLTRQGQPLDAGPFTVTPTRMDDRGIEELVFTFHQPLASPDCHFFFGSPQFAAYPLDISRGQNGL